MLSIHLKAKTKIKFTKALSGLIVATLAFFVLYTPLAGQARIFDPNNIITDDDLFDSAALSKTAIQIFLERENSVLSRFSQTVSGQTLKASEMIWQVSRNHGVNPKFILTTLEKEQSLISSTYASEKALDWATGYGCFGGGCMEKYRGFFNQIDATAETQEIYRQKANTFYFIAGQTATTYDGFKVTPKNQATANLYIYTPYVGNAPELGINSRFGANKLFWRIWNRYFPSQKFLDGQIITDGNNYWLIKNNLKYKFASAEIFLADHNIIDAIRTDSKNLIVYPDGPTIYFPNNTLVKSDASGQVFLIDNLTKRAVVDASALALLSDFRIASVNQEQIVSVPESQLQAYDLGTLIFSTSVYPQGKLFQDETSQIWLVKDGLKHLVDSVVYQQQFTNSGLEQTTTTSLEVYPTGEQIKLTDGTFIKTTDGRYYLISNGERMRVANAELFSRLFGPDKQAGALNVSDELLNIHEAGEMIDYIDDTILDPVSPTITPVAGNYAAEFTEMQPDSLILINGAKVNLTLSFKNIGSDTWQQGSVWLVATDKDKDTSSFGGGDKINFDQSSVTSGETADFELSLATPTDQSGLMNQEFSLYYNKNGVPTKITSVAKFIIVKPGIAAEVVDQNIPLAVKNNWKPIEITMHIKNISLDTTWLSRKTALEIYNQDNTPSVFYDPNDWVRKEVAAVPIKTTYVKPGQTGEFKFTLDPRGLKPGTYILRFKLKLLDKEKDVYLDGGLSWDRLIRVD